MIDPKPIGGGINSLVAHRLRETADEVEASPEVIQGYLVAVVCCDGGVNWSAEGAELTIIGALEHAKHRLMTRWDEDGPR